MCKMRPMSENDLMAFMGAEGPDQFTRPYIGEVPCFEWPEDDLYVSTFDPKSGIDYRAVSSMSKGCAVIADRYGLSVQGLNGSFVLPCTFHVALIIAEGLKWFDRDTCRKLGFQLCNLNAGPWFDLRTMLRVKESEEC